MNTVTLIFINEEKLHSLWMVGYILAFSLKPTTLVQDKCLFQHLRVQYEIDFKNENIFRVKSDCFKMKCLLNCDII